MTALTLKCQLKLLKNLWRNESSDDTNIEVRNNYDKESQSRRL